MLKDLELKSQPTTDLNVYELTVFRQKKALELRLSELEYENQLLNKACSSLRDAITDLRNRDKIRRRLASR